MNHENTAALLFLACVAVCLVAYFYEKEIENMAGTKKINEEPIKQTFKPRRDPKYIEGKPFIDTKKKLPSAGHCVEIKQIGGIFNRAYLDQTKIERIDVWVLNQRSIYLGLADVVGWREIE